MRCRMKDKPQAHPGVAAGPAYLVFLSVLGGFQSHPLTTDVAKVEVGRQCGDSFRRAGIIPHGVVDLQPLS